MTAHVLLISFTPFSRSFGRYLALGREFRRNPFFLHELSRAWTFGHQRSSTNAKINMNDLIAQLDASCVIIIKLSVAVVLLTVARLIYKRGVPVQPVAWGKWPETVTTGGGHIVQMKSYELKPAPATAATVAQSLQEVAALPECGNCRNEIKSAPVRVASENGKLAQYFNCEHCGMPVKLET